MSHIDIFRLYYNTYDRKYIERSNFTLEVCPDRVESWENGSSVTCGTLPLPIEYPQGRCEAGWQEHEISTGRACLQINRGTFQIDYALQSCHDQDAKLAQPLNQYDNDLFADLIGYSNEYDLWLAMSDEANEGTSI